MPVVISEAPEIQHIFNHGGGHRFARTGFPLAGGPVE